MNLIRIAGVAGLLIVAAPAAPATAEPRADTGTFTFIDPIVIQPGDPASCSFTVTGVQVGRGNFQVLRDASGTPLRVMVHSIWTGTLTANGRTDVEHAVQNETFNLVDGTQTVTGSIHDQAFGQGVLIHDVGILRFNADGSLAFEAGPHDGFDGNPGAIAALCASLS